MVRAASAAVTRCLSLLHPLLRHPADTLALQNEQAMSQSDDLLMGDLAAQVGEGAARALC